MISVTVQEGSLRVVNLRVDQSSLLHVKDVLALVSSEDVHDRLASVQTGSDAGSRDTMQDRKLTSNFT